MSVKQGGNTIAGLQDISGKANIALDNLTSAGKAVCANMAMPSNSYINLTLGASGADYVAPADGYVVFTASGGNFIYIEISGLAVFNQPSNANWYSVWCPVRKGGTFYVGYNGATSEQFRFVYAVGAQ